MNTSKNKMTNFYFTITFIPCELGKLIKINYQERKKLCNNYSKIVFNNLIDYINNEKHINIIKKDTSPILLSECRLTLLLKTDNKIITTKQKIKKYIINKLKDNKLCYNYMFENPYEKYNFN